MPETNVTVNPATEKQGEGGTATAQQQTQTEKTYSETEYQKMASGQYAAGIAAAMKEAGFEATKGEDFKTQMGAFRAWQDSQKTELEKANDAKAVADGKNADYENMISALNLENACLKSGVNPDFVDDAVVLAGRLIDEKTDANAAIAKVLERHQNFKTDAATTTKTDNKPQFSQKTETQTDDEKPKTLAEAIKARLNKNQT